MRDWFVNGGAAAGWVAFGYLLLDMVRSARGAWEDLRDRRHG